MKIFRCVGCLVIRWAAACGSTDYVPQHYSHIIKHSKWRRKTPRNEGEGCSLVPNN